MSYNPPLYTTTKGDRDTSYLESTVDSGLIQSVFNNLVDVDMTALSTTSGYEFISDVCDKPSSRHLVAKLKLSASGVPLQCGPVCGILSMLVLHK